MFVKIDLWNKSYSNNLRAFFWQEFIVKSTARKLVFDGKAFLNSVRQVLPGSVKIPQNLRLIDPVVGCWLLKPDSPVTTFIAAANALLPRGGATRAGGDSATDIRQEMELLSAMCREMFRKLEEQNLWPLFYQLEMRILPALVTMESVGVIVNRDKLESLGHDLDRKMTEIQGEAVKLAGRVFNLSSPKQVREVLYDGLRLDAEAGLQVGRTQGGVKSTCEAVLVKLARRHPLPGLVLQHRQMAKYKGTYVDGILGHVGGDSRVVTSWDQVATATGRVTSVSPNIQAIPKGEIDIGGGCLINIRDAFIPPPGHMFLSADFEQIEFRIFGHLSQDPAITGAIKEGGDIFKKLASFWLEKDVENVTVDDRDKTKRVVYALMYGAGKIRLSEILEVSVQQASVIITSFYTKFSTLKSFNQKVIAMAEKNGYLTTLLGRRRYFPFISSSNPALKAQAQRQAFNFLIQGSAAVSSSVQHELVTTFENCENV